MSERLDILRPILSQFKRRFSVFSLGSGIDSGLEQEIANEFDCVVVCAEKDPLKYTPQGRVIVLQREFTADDLDLLSKCEHFDVVLAMNVLHWMDRSWLKSLCNLGRLGDTLIIQTPWERDSGACGGGWNGEIVVTCRCLSDDRMIGVSTQFDGHMDRPIYVMTSLCGFLFSKTFGAEENVEAIVMDGKIRLCHKHEMQTFIPGLTLSNFKTLTGVWPEREAIVTALRAMKWNGKHRDIQPWNIRYDGVECYLIDPGGADWVDSDAENLEAVIKWV